ncbi:tape measure protein [Acidovorax sp. Root217]|uniref:tape measure protein n=1 Tax=Acidovorax sp. Root217 TaxID=1736492 RepID=UPI0009EA511D|nr:tape measure protein [Acidovorax sp. Root217]
MSIFESKKLNDIVGAVNVDTYVRAADAVTSLNTSLMQATGSSAAAQSAYEALLGTANRSRIGVGELGKAYANISIAGQQAGIAQQRLLAVTDSVASAMVVGGGSAQNLKVALEKLSEAMGAGVVSGEQLKGMMDQSPRLAQALADGLDVPIAKLREMAAAGKISADQVVTALQSQSGALAKEAATTALTVEQAFNQLTSAGTAAVGSFDKTSGASAALASAISSVAGAVGAMGAAFKENTVVVNTVMGALTGAVAVSALTSVPRAIAAIGVAVTGLGATLALHPAVLALLGVGAVVGGTIALIRQRSDTLEGLDGQIAILQDANKRSEAALQRALDAGRTSGADRIRETMAGRDKQISDLKARIAVESSAGIDNRAEDARFERGVLEQRLRQSNQGKNAPATQPRKPSQESNADLDTLLKVRQLVADRRNKEYEEIAAAVQADEQAAAKSIQSIQERIAGLNSEEKVLEKSRSLNVSLAEAIEIVAIERLKEQQSQRNPGTGGWDTLQQEIDRRQELLTAISAKVSREKSEEAGKKAVAQSEEAAKKAQEKSEEAAKKAQEQWKATADSINKSLTDVFMKSLDSGKDFGKNLGDALKEQFKNLVLKPTISAMVSPISGALSTLVSGVMGGSNGPLATVGGGSAGGGLLGNLMTVGQIGYQTYTGQGVMGSVGNAISGWLGGSAVTTANMAGPIASKAALDGTASFGVNSQLGNTLGGAGTAGMGFMGYAAIMAVLANAMGFFRSKNIVGSGLKGTLGGATLTPWEEERTGGTLFYGADFETTDPIARYKELKRRDQEAIARFKAEGAVSGVSATYNGQAYDRTLAASSILNYGTYDEDMERMIGLVQAQSDGIQKGYNEFRKNLVGMANDLGLAGDKIADFTFDLGQQDLNFQGLDDAKIQEKITVAFGKAGASMAKEVLGQWITETVDVIKSTQLSQLTDSSDALYNVEVEQVTRKRYEPSEYAKAGETAFDTLTRLATSFNTLNEASDALGFGIHQGSLALADFADDFIEAFGGLETFTNSTNAFLNAYYTDEERKDSIIRSAVRRAEGLGIQGLTYDKIKNGTRMEFREYVNSATDNPALYKDAIDLALMLDPVFGSFEAQTPVVQDLSNVVDELTQSYQNAVESLTSDRDSLAVELLRAQGDEKGAKALEKSQYMAQFAGLDEVRRKEIETLYDANVATRAYIQGIKDAAQAQLDALTRQRDSAVQMVNTASSNTDAAFARFEEATNKERERLQGVIDAARGVFDATKAAAQSLLGEVEAAVQSEGLQGRDFISASLVAAQTTGKLPDGKLLSEAIEAVGKDFAATTYASQSEADYERLVVANELKGLQDISGDQLTEAERQAEKLDKDLEQGREMISAIRGIDTSVGTLSETLAALIGAYNQESRIRSNVAAQGALGKDGAYYNYQTGTGLNSSGVYFEGAAIREAAAIALDQGATAKDIYDVIAGSGFSLAQAEAILGATPGSFEDIAKQMDWPIFHRGTRSVPRTGFALLQQGEAVIPAAYNPFTAGRGWNNSNDMLTAMEGVRAELIEVRRQNDQLQYAATRTADAVNGRPEAPMLVENV